MTKLLRLWSCVSKGYRKTKPGGNVLSGCLLLHFVCLMGYQYTRKTSCSAAAVVAAAAAAAAVVSALDCFLHNCRTTGLC